MNEAYKHACKRITMPDALREQVLNQCEREGRGGRGLRMAVCAAAAVAVVLGTATPRREAGPESAAPLDYRFGLTVSAAEAGENHALCFPWQEGAAILAVEGTAELTVTSDRGTLKDAGEGRYTLTPLPGQTMESLDGAEVTVLARFPGGEEKEETYALTAERLRTVVSPAGEAVLSPTLPGDTAGEIPALYAVTAESRLLDWPVAESRTVRLSAPYGVNGIRPDGSGIVHTGIDIAGERGLSVTAAGDGTVTETGFEAQRGRYVIVDHGGGLTTLYGQCQEVTVTAGQQVAAGEEIALLGVTGMAAGPHLHFEVRQDGVHQNPVAYFSAQVRRTLHTAG